MTIVYVLSALGITLVVLVVYCAVSGECSEQERRAELRAAYREGLRDGRDEATAGYRGCSIDRVRQMRVKQEVAE